PTPTAATGAAFSHTDVPRDLAVSRPYAAGVDGVAAASGLKIRWVKTRGSSSLPPGTREITVLAAPGGLLAAGVSMNVSMNFPALSRRARSERQLAGAVAVPVEQSSIGRRRGSSRVSPFTSRQTRLTRDHG